MTETTDIEDVDFEELKNHISGQFHGRRAIVTLETLDTLMREFSIHYSIRSGCTKVLTELGFLSKMSRELALWEIEPSDYQD